MTKRKTYKRAAIDVQSGYSFLIGIEKTLFRLITIAGPVLFELFPDAWMNITLGAAITMLVNYAKNKDLEKKAVEAR